ncbi:MAG TPA: CHAP domain-containing protein [Fimbriiglobus sp.]|nr:CHAP domain-containing protein [Fimbriiglobus sp.]
MAFDYTDRFIVLFCAGVGLTLAGVVNALAGRLGIVWRAVLTGAGCGVALAGVSAIKSDPALLVAAAAVMAAGVLPALLAGSAPLVELARKAAAVAVRPGVRWVLLAGAGVGLAAGSIAWYDFEDAVRSELDLQDLDLEFGRPPLVESSAAVARTDRGTPVPGKRPIAPRADAETGEVERRFLQKSPFRDQMMRQRKADDGSNCHGWVFTGGRYWLDPEAVELILRENGYVDVTAPRPGDVVIYRSHGSIGHTAVVRYVSDAAPPLVEGKWGAMGVYVHPVDQCVYGTAYTFYRSARPGHLLAGLTDTSPPTP